jgi:hypothetical protein
VPATPLWTWITFPAAQTPPRFQAAPRFALVLHDKSVCVEARQSPSAEHEVHLRKRADDAIWQRQQTKVPDIICQPQFFALISLEHADAEAMTNDD